MPCMTCADPGKCDRLGLCQDFAKVSLAEDERREVARLRDALRVIADMDPASQRADDLGRAARVARAALDADGVGDAK